MNLYNDLDGKKKLAIKNFLLQLYNDLTDAGNNLTEESEFGYDLSTNRIVYFDGNGVKPLASVDDINAGNGSTTYIGIPEPTGVPGIGIIDGDAWFNPSTGLLQIKNGQQVDGTPEWYPINDNEVNFLMPKVNVNTQYPQNATFFYSADNPVDPDVSGGDDSFWVNDTNSPITTGSTITGTADLIALGFSKIEGGGTVDTGTLELDSSWTDGQIINNPTSSIISVERSGSSLIITFENTVSNILFIKIFDLLGEEILVESVNGFLNSTATKIITLNFRDWIEENFNFKYYQ